MVFPHRYSLQVIRRIWIGMWANDSIELSVRFHPTLSGWKNKKSKLIETWLETEGVLALDIVNQKNKKQKKPHKPFTIFFQYYAILFLELKAFFL